MCQREAAARPSSSTFGSWLSGKLKPPGTAPERCLPLSVSQKAAIGNTWASEGARWGGVAGWCSCTAGKADPHTAWQHLAMPLPCTLCLLLRFHFSSRGPSWPLSALPAHTLPELSCCARGAGPISVSQEQGGGRMQIPRPEWVPPCAERTLGKETSGSTQAGLRVMVLT